MNHYAEFRRRGNDAWPTHKAKKRQHMRARRAKRSVIEQRRAES